MDVEARADVVEVAVESARLVQRGGEGRTAVGPGAGDTPSDAVTSISSRDPRPNRRRRRTSRVARITASPPRSRRTWARASLIVPAR